MKKDKFQIILILFLVLISGLGINYKAINQTSDLSPEADSLTGDPDYFSIFYKFFKDRGCRDPTNAAKEADECRKKYGDLCISSTRVYVEEMNSCIQACRAYNSPGTDCRKVCEEIVNPGSLFQTSECMKEYLLCLEKAVDNHCRPR